MTHTITTPLRPNDVIETILTRLGELDRKYISESIDNLIQQNLPFSASVDGFLYGGRFFTNLPANKVRFAKKQPLHFSLQVEGDQLVQSLKEFDNDTRYLKQGLTVLLRDCKTAQDFRDVLPNSIRMIISEWNSIDRTREVAYTIKDKPLLFDQYHFLEERLHHYLSKRLLA